MGDTPDTLFAVGLLHSEVTTPLLRLTNVTVAVVSPVAVACTPTELDAALTGKASGYPPLATGPVTALHGRAMFRLKSGRSWGSGPVVRARKVSSPSALMRGLPRRTPTYVDSVDPEALKVIVAGA